MIAVVRCQRGHLSHDDYGNDGDEEKDNRRDTTANDQARVTASTAGEGIPHDQDRATQTCDSDRCVPDGSEPGHLNRVLSHVLDALPVQRPKDWPESGQQGALCRWDADLRIRDHEHHHGQKRGSEGKVGQHQTISRCGTARAMSSVMSRRFSSPQEPRRDWSSHDPKNRSDAGPAARGTHAHRHDRPAANECVRN